MTNFIIEVANTHGGDKKYLLDLIQEFESFNQHGIKFQPLHPEKIATPDFQWYPVYQELFFERDEWKEIIEKAKESKRVWLDLFDTYGVAILKDNLGSLYGIKLQASILYNEEVIEALAEADCSSLKLIINISAIDLEQVKERIESLQKKIAPEQILLEVGFQAYPTQLQDCGLNKIKVLKERFDFPIVFADHAAGESKDALTLPLIASMLGADYLEKHVMHSSLETKYDHFSAIQVDKYRELVQMVSDYSGLHDMAFINNKEIEYLKNSIQKPIASKNLNAGQLVNSVLDLKFRRSGTAGLSALDIKELTKSGYVLSQNIQEGNTFQRVAFKKAIIGTIIAARLKSSRLKRKALLNIGAMTSVEKCIQSCLKLPNSSYTILATSTSDEDAELEHFTYAPQVVFHKGHPDDVIQRYLGVTEKLGLDVVIRVTADMPYVSKEITEVLLQAHFESGADYTAARQSSVGTTPEIINVEALKRVKQHFPSADYSEYMTWYFQNNKEHFKVNLIDLPEELIRDYRLTLDYQEDLDLFNAMESHLQEAGKEGTLGEIYEFLDSNPEVARMNSHITLKYKTDQSLIDTLNRVTKISSI
jgi:spore coat polysaccharide biosynthesis protein SpsF (cytidylyltransferase family)/sialic acid synthase SpsE